MVWIGGGKSTFTTKTWWDEENVRVPQGSPCSPLLFNILIDPVVRYLLLSNPGLLLCHFADDTVISWAFLLVGLQINQTKSAFMYLDPERPPSSRDNGKSAQQSANSNTWVFILVKTSLQRTSMRRLWLNSNGAA
jgi:hypothetical protein